MIVRFVWLLSLLAAILYVTGWSSALAHEAPSGWTYSPWCCNRQDCRQLADDDVQERRGGWYIKSMDVFVGHDHPKLEVSGDEHYHVCELPKGTVRCFYFKPGGV